MIPPLAAWPALAALPARPLAGGLINTTWAVGEPPVAVVQALHPIFRPEVNLDIDAVTAWLAAEGMLTPRPLSTADGALWTLSEGRCFRALSWVPGQSFDRLRDPSLAAQAGALVGRWHRATSGFQHDFHFRRPGAHDTEAHLGKLRAAVEGGRAHRLHARVARLAERIEAGWRRWGGDLGEPTRVAHGDLKISNLRFDELGRGLCLLDLDTMGHLPLSVEMGDAWRSWCNPRGEDVEEADFDLRLFEASASGWLGEMPLPREQREALVWGLERIALELSARFAADALLEAYFGWDPRVAAGRGEHNLLRAMGQCSLAEQAARARGEIERVLLGS
jgi:Ser/Thr protein kinase RdoA (MazF antagonist)